MSEEGWRWVDKSLALIGAMGVGVLIHHVSRALGLEVTTPGVIIGTAIAAIGLSSIRWNFD